MLSELLRAASYARRRWGSKTIGVLMALSPRLDSMYIIYIYYIILYYIKYVYKYNEYVYIYIHMIIYIWDASLVLLRLGFTEGCPKPSLPIGDDPNLCMAWKWTFFLSAIDIYWLYMYAYIYTYYMCNCSYIICKCKYILYIYICLYWCTYSTTMYGTLRKFSTSRPTKNILLLVLWIEETLYSVTKSSIHQSG